MHVLLATVLTGFVGLLSAGFVAGTYVDWYQVTSREGASGYLIVAMALVGGFIGMALGAVSSWFLASTGLAQTIGWPVGCVVGSAALAWLALFRFADIPPKVDGSLLRLEVEIRLPVGSVKPVGHGSFTLGSVVGRRERAAERGELHLERVRSDGGRWVIPADVFLFTARGERSIVAEMDGASIVGFLIPLPARPGSAFESWSAWGPVPPAGEPPWPDSRASVRFRVQRMVPPTP
ncbi:MAG: hypothetical protein FJ297_05555 [Planctomycetes bacterium]|nr:hypothetical protein [Planctomycetota bacterium]